MDIALILLSGSTIRVKLTSSNIILRLIKESRISQLKSKIK